MGIVPTVAVRYVKGAQRRVHGEGGIAQSAHGRHEGAHVAMGDGLKGEQNHAKGNERSHREATPPQHAREGPAVRCERAPLCRWC